METWYKASNEKMDLKRVRLAWDYEEKHTYSVRDVGVDKERGEHLYKGVEYRIELDDEIRLTIDEKSSRKVNWRTEMSGDEIRTLFEYANDESWINGWEPVAEILEVR
jgi:hypothetical protein